MRTRKILLFLLSLTCCFALVLSLGTAVKNSKIYNAFASVEAKALDEVTLVMDKGAAVRKDTPTGLRYRSLLSVADYNALEANGQEYQRITYGMLIAPKDYLIE